MNPSGIYFRPQFGRDESQRDWRTGSFSCVPLRFSFVWNFRKAFRSGLPLTVVTFLAGCAVGPDYKRPQATTIPAAYTGATNVVATDAGTTNGWKVAEPQA